MKIAVCKAGADVFATDLAPTSKADMYKEYIVERTPSGFDLYSRYDNFAPTWIGHFDNVTSISKWFESKTGKPAPPEFIQSL